ncbi:hypothetical protein Plec18167_009169 [Paecilomyces lecythidis]|uniref:Uncharacterized protein n=1 Tax=Paecilomyces lecythidis TaxID=3004212 RepID=A0ABR3WRJ2_9EURO
MPYPAQSREKWNELSKNKTEVQKILQELFGNEWPQFTCGVTRDFDKEGLIQMPGQGAAMGLEDAETLSHTLSYPQFLSDYKRLLRIWQNHRKERLVLVKNLTDISGRLRLPDSALVQYANEWVIWGNMKWTGLMGNMQWLDRYNAEGVLKLY